MEKVQNEKFIMINILFLLLPVILSAQSFKITEVISKKNAVEITLLNKDDSSIYVPKFSLRRTAKEKCNIEYWSYRNDTLYLTFTRTAPDCLKGSIVAQNKSDSFLNELKYVDKLLKPDECYKQTLVLEKQIDFKYIQLTYDAFTTFFEKRK